MNIYQTHAHFLTQVFPSYQQQSLLIENSRSTVCAVCDSCQKGNPQLPFLTSRNAMGDVRIVSKRLSFPHCDIARAVFWIIGKSTAVRIFQTIQPHTPGILERNNLLQQQTCSDNSLNEVRKQFLRANKVDALVLSCSMVFGPVVCGRVYVTHSEGGEGGIVDIRLINLDAMDIVATLLTKILYFG